jgi:hypothetical protein
MYMAERCNHHHHHHHHFGCSTISETSAPLRDMSHINYVITVHIHRSAATFSTRNVSDRKTEWHRDLSIVFAIAHQLTFSAAFD